MLEGFLSINKQLFWIIYIHILSTLDMEFNFIAISVRMSITILSLRKKNNGTHTLDLDKRVPAILFENVRQIYFEKYYRPENHKSEHS